MYCSKQFREIIIQPTLKLLNHYSIDAENCLIMIMAHETGGGHYLRQLGNGPAFGPYEMEKNTFDWVFSTKVVASLVLGNAFKTFCSWDARPEAEDMQYNLKLATAMARIFLLDVPDPIPKDICLMSQYCKKHWNTPMGKATAQDYFLAYLSFDKQ